MGITQSMMLLIALVEIMLLGFGTTIAAVNGVRGQASDGATCLPFNATANLAPPSLCK